MFGFTFGFTFGSTFGSTRRRIRNLLAASGLPAGLAGLVLEVVRRTRLRRAEQLDVAAELVSHFAEGLAAGRSADELAARYGDPRRSARELRQAAISKRNPIDRAAGLLARGIAWTTGLAVLVYAFAALALHVRQPTISFDGVAALDGAIARPGAEGPAIDLYLEALAAPDGHSRLRELVPVLDRLESRSWIYGSDEDARAEARALLGPLSREIEILRRVRDRPVLGMPLVTSPMADVPIARFFDLVPTGSARGDSGGDSHGDHVVRGSLFSVLLPHLAMLRSTSKLLAIDAGLAAIEGRTEDFLADVEAILAMSGHAGECRVAIGSLVECGIHRIALAAVTSAIENQGSRFSLDELARLDRLVRGSAPDLARGLDGERLMLRDVVQRTFTDDGNGDGVLLAGAMRALERETTLLGGETSPPPLLRAFDFASAPLVAATSAGRRETAAWIEEHFDLLAAAIGAPTRDESLAKALAADLRVLDTRTRGNGPRPVILMAPALGQMVARGWSAECAVDAALAAIAIERFRRTEGRFPKDFVELSAAAGRQLGRWSHPSTPWRYDLVDGRPLLHDVGLDGIDDRARLPKAGVDPDFDPDFDRDLDPALNPDLAAQSVPIRRFGELDRCAADAVLGPVAPGTRTTRTAPLLDAAWPLDPEELLLDGWQRVSAADPAGPPPLLPAHLTENDGDSIRVWWGSRAAGPTRVTPVR